MLSFKYFAMRVKKCLRIASFLLRGMFSFVCSVVRLFKETNVPSLAVPITKHSLVLN